MKAEITSPYRSVSEMLQRRVEESADREAYRYPAGTGWQSLTWAQTFERVRAIALGLHAVGIESQQRCAILASTRFEWILADLGILSAGAATTTIYPSSTPEECAYIIADSQSQVVFAEDDEQVDKLRGQRAELPDLHTVITFDGTSDGDWVLRLDEVEERGRTLAAQQPELFDELLGGIEPEHLATLVYTSGTTGRPKGVRLTHANWLYVAESMDALDESMLTEQDLQYLWLPLSHVFGKVMEMGQLRKGFPTAVDGNVDRLIDNLPVVQPTIMAAAPRIFEKVYNKVVTQAKEGGALKYRIFRWACGVGARVSRLNQRHQPIDLRTRIQYAIADRLVFQKLRARFGGRLRYFISGSAPLSPEIAEFFDAAGVRILEGYGLTETCAATFVNLPTDYRIGTVGRPFPGTEISFAEDGEILIRNGAVMHGYHRMPEETAAALDEDGWFHTGDIGAMEDGFLRITDRKKDLIKTSGGKYVAPQSVEGRFKAVCPYVGNVIVHGDERPYCTALVTLDEEAIAQWARDNGLGDRSYEQLAAEEPVRALIESYVDEVNAGLARHETIKSFAILPRDLTIENGEITPSLKVKRKVVENNYTDLLEGLYPNVRQAL
ncbi:long-chain acyl-CoA synthetase [Halopolyspora algeriensis]|uniref:Acyl-CoA synthetase n=1 Tax=Halopolyspora algeriensis TaxID=1500506 RepID=A0A368VVI8_9ACTN|nr:long-chain fatty acid--CoA ligase [Halopolyspora algeriensis]RCW45905.1 long-chain acyl-CoA synthetase [Halopolyspora algeriensis]TQM55319.1 long-chain acyl-CoA synthetase [Halopolyspora algeriensis]